MLLATPDGEINDKGFIAEGCEFPAQLLMEELAKFNPEAKFLEFLSSHVSVVPFSPVALEVIRLTFCSPSL